MADGVELGGVEAVEVVFGEATGAEQVGEDVGQDGVAVIEVVIDAAALFAKPPFQVPEVRGFRDPRGVFLCFPDDGFEFPAKGQIEGSASGCLLRWRPLLA